MEIPYLVNVEAAAHDASGDGFLVDVDLIEVEPSGLFYPEWFCRSEYGVSSERLRLIRVSGDSMVPALLPGQRALIAVLPPGAPLRDGQIYVIDGPGGVLVKRLYLTPDHVTVHSDNPTAPTYNVALETWNHEYHLRAVVLETPQRH
ncbi:MAG: S24 family peptidase [Bacteroidota bacterium]